MTLLKRIQLPELEPFQKTQNISPCSLIYPNKISPYSSVIKGQHCGIEV